MRALGLMSGTSMDGIAVAMLDSDGEDQVVRGTSLTFPYNSEQRGRIAEAMGLARGCETRMARPGVLPVIERELTELHAAAVAAFLRKTGIPRASVEIVGFHGQTVVHRPEIALTMQLGDGPLLAELTGLPIVYDLRANDVASGGQGAPLVPIYHRALMSARDERPMAIVNIGGVANVTWIGRDGTLLAFDTGPGNALVDDWMRKRAGVAYDEDGKLGAKGTINEDVVRFCLSQSFFAKPPPKSLDRNAFAWDIVDWMTLEDGAATLTQFSAAAIAKSREHMPEQPALWIMCGGGRKNRTLMSAIAGLVENAVVPAEAVGLDGDAIEAEAWAYLAIRSLKGLPITFPGTTGVRAPMQGGVLVKPAQCVA